MLDKNKIQNIRYYKYPVNTYAKIYSLKGSVDEVSIIAEAQYENQTIYITKYKDITCSSIFNPFVCEYFTDDVYTVIGN